MYIKEIDRDIGGCDSVFIDIVWDIDIVTFRLSEKLGDAICMLLKRIGLFCKRAL